MLLTLLIMLEAYSILNQQAKQFGLWLTKQEIVKFSVTNDQQLLELLKHVRQYAEDHHLIASANIVINHYWNTMKKIFSPKTPLTTYITFCEMLNQFNNLSLPWYDKSPMIGILRLFIWLNRTKLLNFCDLWLLT